MICTTLGATFSQQCIDGLVPPPQRIDVRLGVCVGCARSERYERHEQDQR